KKIWAAPTRGVDQTALNDFAGEGLKLPPEGTNCKFAYAGVTYVGIIKDGHLVVEGIDRPFATFSGASKTITRTNRNGWNDWYLRDDTGGWALADDWRQQAGNAPALESADED